jgi:hypothetical protein
MFRSTLQMYGELIVGVRRVFQGVGNYPSISFYNLIYLFSNSVFNNDISYISTRLFNCFYQWCDRWEFECDAGMEVQL